MARNLLTALSIKNSSAAKLRDGDGLWLHRSKAGGQYWVFIYIRDGKRREMGLGSFGSGTGSVTLIAARAKAEEIRMILGKGGDPFLEMEERKARIKVADFGEIADAYIETMKSRWKGAKTEAGWKLSLGTYAKDIRKLPVDRVSTADVLKCIEPIWHTKAETAGKVRERIKMVLDHAKVKGLRTGDNPAQWSGHLDHMLPSPEKLQRGHHKSMPYTELPAFMERLRASEGTGARALEFTILTAVRSGEARGAIWPEIDLKKKIWTIPSNRMKSDKQHRVPLSDRAVQIVEDMMAVSISNYVFPGAKLNSQLSDMTLAKAVKTAKADVTVHGFRSSFRDWVAESTNFQSEVAEAALAHVTGDAVERAYRRGDVLAKRREMMSAWSKYLTKK
ncbi:tyrosine-type recombinase/integrase [Phyllobacterium meliloti]|uniref:tyrosine-type recombinase/integrase n=1 Tax=Phyllobacterium meliloti TaxID=555317 RepID=UPI001D139067|nr:site-specific integrase [Phyllobacterium sp. T1293]UGX87102.1 tyrosine-type recombinase/integrase [Phyllobacterium sp. T1293]